MNKTWKIILFFFTTAIALNSLIWLGVIFYGLMFYGTVILHEFNFKIALIEFTLIILTIPSIIYMFYYGVTHD